MAKTCPSSYPMTMVADQRSTRRVSGLSMVEMLIALVITALLMTATMMATDTSFKAYANATAQVSAQASTRLVTQRLMTLVRSSRAHGPLTPGSSSVGAVTLSGDTLTGPYLEMIDPQEKLVRIEYRSDAQEVWLVMSSLDGSGKTEQPLLTQVTAASFSCTRRKTNDGLWVLARGTMNITVTPTANSSIDLERTAAMEPIRVIASTMPRRLQGE